MGEIISSLIGAGLTAVGAATSIPFLIGAAVVGYIAATLSSVLLSLGGLITGVAFNLQEMIVSPQNNIVDVGWAIVRDVANLGFVLVIIFIAFATIFRIETYGVKKLLPRLIAAAILVNFSLAIAGVFIDFAQALSGFFLDRISLDPLTIGTNLLGAFGPQRFWSGVDFNNIAGALTSLTSGAIMFVIGPYFITLFNLTMFIVIVTLGFMLIVRFLYLSFLLIVAPITWLFWLIPRLSGLFSQWWTKFFEWVFFAPAVSFFLYLSFFSAEKLKSFTRGGEAALTGIDGIIGNIFLSGVEVILLCGFMIGGLIVAKNMGITGAKGAVGIFQNAGKAAQNWAGRQGKHAGAWALESKPMSLIAGALQKTPGFRRVGMALGGQANILRRGLVDDADKRTKKYGDAHLAKNLDALSEPERVAALERLAKNDTMGLIKDRAGNGNTLGSVTAENKKLFERYYGANTPKWKAVELGAGMNVASADAVRANDVTRLRSEMKEWIKGLKPEQIGKLPINDIFNGKDDLADIGFKPGDAAAAEAFRVAVVNAVAQNVPGDIAKLFKNVKSAGFDKLYRTTEYVHDFIEPVDSERAKKIEDALSRIASVRLYESAGGVEPPAAPAASPPPAAGPTTP